MSKRLTSLIATAGALAVAGALMLTGGASGATGAGPLPTLNIALTGTTGVSVSGSEVSGAVNVVSTFSGKAPSGPNSNGPTWGLVRLNPGVSILQAVGAVQSAHGDVNALTPYGSLFADNSAGVPTQTVLTPGNYVALNITGNGNPGLAPFTVTQSSSPAALPNAAATETAIEFAFRGPDRSARRHDRARPERRLPGAHGHRDRREERRHRAASHGAAPRRQGRQGA